MTTPQQGASELTREQLIMALRNVAENHESWNGTAQAALDYIERTTAVAPAVAEPADMRDVKRALYLVMSARSQDRVLLEAENYLKRALAAPAERTAQPTDASEPVAYRSRLRGSCKWVLTETAGEGHPDVECEPLYTAQPTGASDRADVFTAFNAICKLHSGELRNEAFLWFSHGYACEVPAQPNWRVPLEALVAKWENELRKVGGMDNELISVPAGGVRDMLAELRTTIAALAAQHGDGG